MDLRRVRVWEWLTGLAGIALLITLFLPWYETPAGENATAWEAFTVTDVVLTIVALAALTLPALAATQRTAAVPQAWTALLIPIWIVAAVFAVVRILNLPGDLDGRALGLWLGAVALLAIFLLNYRSMSDKRFPKAMRPRLDVATIPAPTADGKRRDVAS